MSHSITTGAPEPGRRARARAVMLLCPLAAAVLAACGSTTPPVAVPRGVLTGEIFIIGVPTPPEGPPSPAGVVTVFTNTGAGGAGVKVIARIEVPRGGRFRIELPAGQYLIAAEVKRESNCAPASMGVAGDRTSSTPVRVGCA